MNNQTNEQNNEHFSFPTSWVELENKKLKYDSESFLGWRDEIKQVKSDE